MECEFVKFRGGSGFLVYLSYEGVYLGFVEDLEEVPGDFVVPVVNREPRWLPARPRRMRAQV